MDLATSHSAKRSARLALTQWMRYCRELQQAGRHLAMRIQHRQKAQVFNALRWAA